MFGIDVSSSTISSDFDCLVSFDFISFISLWLLSVMTWSPTTWHAAPTKSCICFHFHLFPTDNDRKKRGWSGVLSATYQGDASTVLHHNSAHCRKFVFFGGELSAWLPSTFDLFGDYTAGESPINLWSGFWSQVIATMVAKLQVTSIMDTAIINFTLWLTSLCLSIHIWQLDEFSMVDFNSW